MNEFVYSIAQEMDIPFFSAGVATESSESYVVWQIISDVPGQTIGYSSNVSKVRVQFDVYSLSQRKVFEISKYLERSMRGKGLVLLRNGPFFNIDTKMYRRSVDMSFFRKEN